MKESTRKMLVGILGMTGTVVAAGATVSAIRNSDAAVSTKILAAGSGAIAGACALDRAMDIYLEGQRKRDIEREVEERLKKEIETEG